MRLTWIASLAATCLALTACAGGAGRTDDGRPLVVAAVYPLGFAAASVAGDRATIESLTPPGAEPHDLELSPSQVRLLHEADLVLYVGSGFQPSVESLAEQLDGRAVDVLDVVEVLEGHDDEHGDEHGPEDPHVWLDPARMAQIVAIVAEKLVEVDPDARATYAANADAMRASLAELDDDLATGLEGCEGRRFIVAHEAFGYLADRYELEQVGISGLDPEAEPSPQRLAEVIAAARASGVRTIFAERSASPAAAEIVARAAGAQVDVLDPLEGPPEAGDYLDAMRDNVRRLAAGLGCG